MKIVWKVADAPTGPYRSFQVRGWPVAFWGEPWKAPVAALITCADDYHPRDVREGNHAPLTITVCHWNHPDEPRTAKRFRLKAQAKTLAEAKQLVQKFYDAHKDWIPAEGRQG